MAMKVMKLFTKIMKFIAPVLRTQALGQAKYDHNHSKMYFILENCFLYIHSSVKFMIPG